MIDPDISCDGQAGFNSLHFTFLTRRLHSSIPPILRPPYSSAFTVFAYYSSSSLFQLVLPILSSRMRHFKHIEMFSQKTPVEDTFEEAPNKRLAPCNDYSAVTRRPNHEWTSTQKVILAWLASSYENSWLDLTKLFKAYFIDELPDQPTLSVGAISSIYYCMHLHSDEEAAVSKLRSANILRNAVSFEDSVRALVKRLAADLEIELVCRNPGGPSRTKKAMKSYDGHQTKRKASNLDDSTWEDGPTAPLPIDETKRDTRTLEESQSDIFPRTPTHNDFQYQTSAYPTPSSPKRPEK